MMQRPADDQFLLGELKRTDQIRPRRVHVPDSFVYFHVSAKSAKSCSLGRTELLTSYERGESGSAEFWKPNDQRLYCEQCFLKKSTAENPLLACTEHRRGGDQTRTCLAGRHRQCLADKQATSQTCEMHTAALLAASA
jgi:hypothetical protein